VTHTGEASRTGWGGFRSVLCPIDFSEHSRAALRHAEAIAARGEGSLTVVYAEDPLLIAAGSAALHDPHLVDHSSRDLHGFIDATLNAPAQTRFRLHAKVSVGVPAEEIVQVAGREHSDLIVLGTHGVTGANRLLLGSTTLSVLQRSTLPVLAVPLRKDAGSVAAGWPGSRVLAAIDFDGEPSADADVAACVAHWFDASLTLVHVVQGIDRPVTETSEMSAHDRIRIGQAQERLDALASPAAREVRCDARVVCGDPADEIAALVATERIGLVITSLRDRHGWLGPGRGSISYRVLTHAVAPVLAHPPDWRPR
jgi:nucleotide-binding universal stress UspA family protein